MNKIDPVPKRKTILAWTLVLVFAFICIGAALFAENSQIGASSEKNPFGPSLRINTSEGSSSQTAPVTDGVCATKPNSTQCSRCISTLSTIDSKMAANYGTGISTDSAGTAISDIDELSDSGNMSPTDADNYIAQIKQACEEPVTTSDPCAEANNQLTALSKDGTVPALQTKINELLNSDKSSTEIANTLDFYRTDDAGLIDSTEYPLQSDEMADIADLYDECANSICEDATEQLTALSQDSTIPALQTKLKELLNSSKSPSEISDTLDIYRSDDAGLIDVTNNKLQADEMADIADLFDKCATETKGGTEENGGQTNPNQTTVTDGSNTGTKISDSYKKWFKWMMVAEMLKSIIAGDWETALTSALALGLGSDDITKYAYMLQAANNDPQALLAYVMSDTLDGGGIDYSDLDQIGSTGSNQWYNQNYLQRRATELASDLFMIDAATSILSSVGDLISNFMGDEEAAEFQEKWDGSLESLQEIMTTVTTLNYSDIAGLTNSSLYDDYSLLNWISGGYTNTYSSQYPYGTTTSGTSSSTGYATSTPITDALLSSLSATNNSFYILVRQPLSSLEYNIQKLAGSIFPTSRGIFFLSQYNTLYQLIQNSEYGTAVWQLIK